MGLSLAVILLNLWLKEYEHALKIEINELTTPANNCIEICTKCNKKTTLTSKDGKTREMLELVSC